MSEPDPPVDRGRSPGSRLLSGVDQLASRPLAALIVLTADTAWVLVSVAAGFPLRWENVFQSLVAALTLAMVFVIQHTQARQQAATQRKRDPAGCARRAIRARPCGRMTTQAGSAVGSSPPRGSMLTK